MRSRTTHHRPAPGNLQVTSLCPEMQSTTVENQHLNAPGQGEKRGTTWGRLTCQSSAIPGGGRVWLFFSSAEKSTQSQVFPLGQAAHFPTGLSVLAGRNFSVKILHYPDMTGA